MKSFDYLGIITDRTPPSKEEQDRLHESILKMRETCKGMNISVLLPAADKPGYKRLYSKEHPEGRLVLPAEPIDTVFAWERTPMSRKTNNELGKLPGFFFYPSDTEGLEKLTFEQRCELHENQGLYSLGLLSVLSSGQKGDLECSLANHRIPTHRRPDAVIPSYGNVPIDLREVIEVRGT